jgi:methionyl-tRNA formyltransferase
VSTAVVFAYHAVGVRCLQVLLAHGVEVKMVVTHEDAPGENVWWPSVRDLAREHGIPVFAPVDPHEPKILARLRGSAPDFIFSFYYRHMLKPDVLAIAKHGAYNMHGSLLPKYRGRVPINWAIIHGETETGASLHEMVQKPDAGRLVDQMAVPIFVNDTARDVFDKVAVAAELVLHRTIEPLMAGIARHVPMDLSKGSYFGGRKPEDGRIAWSKPNHDVHNLVRAVTAPYPGAFTDLPIGKLTIWRTHVLGRESEGAPALFTEENTLYARCGNGKLLRIVSADIDGQPLDAANFVSRFGSRSMPLRDTALTLNRPHA